MTLRSLRTALATTALVCLAGLGCRKEPAEKLDEAREEAMQAERRAAEKTVDVQKEAVEDRAEAAAKAGEAQGDIAKMRADYRAERDRQLREIDTRISQDAAFLFRRCTPTPGRAAPGEPCARNGDCARPHPAGDEAATARRRVPNRRRRTGPRHCRR